MLVKEERKAQIRHFSHTGRRKKKATGSLSHDKPRWREAEFKSVIGEEKKKKKRRNPSLRTHRWNVTLLTSGKENKGNTLTHTEMMTGI